MRNLISRGRVVLLMLVALMVSMSLLGLQPRVHSGEPALPDLVPYGLADFRVSLVSGNLGFSILTANIGGQDFERPLDPERPPDPNDPDKYLLRQIYEYALYQQQEDGTWLEIDRRRKRTICTIDDYYRGNVFPCIQQHDKVHSCGGRQGISRGWADDYFRGLTGQFVYIGDNTGQFWLQAILDPDGDLQRQDIPNSGRDGNPDNNFADVFFTWDGSQGEIQEIDYYFDDTICAAPNDPGPITF